jgi:alpha-mannosidase
MAFSENLDLLTSEINNLQNTANSSLERFREEINFARQFAEAFPDKREKWHDLILEAAEVVAKSLSKKGAVNVEKAVKDAEAVLAPIGKKAKEYTIHCCGHAHIDMNWMWPWQETVNVSHDTFYTVNKLMEEFPEFRFSQSQASTYIAMEEYAPEIFKMIKKRVKQGKWDVTASMWVEGDKNIVSGESLCRHMLYTRQYFAQKFGFEPEKVKVDWSCDTFGHCWTMPSILTRGGVTRYYHCRTGPGPWLYKWQSPEGAEILVYNDKPGYNGQIHPARIGNNFVQFLLSTGAKSGVKDYMWMYGVGDHGGGPTRADLRTARDLAKWPIYPVVKLSTTDAFYSAVEASNAKLPVVNKDLNFTFEGCYTAQSNIKRATRVSEIILPEAEVAALVAGIDYPSEQLLKAWRHALFNHFHDILPGSGVHATYEYAQGLFQEIQATAGAIRTRALRSLAQRVNTQLAAQAKVSLLGNGFGDGLGAGAGDPAIPGGITAFNLGAPYAEPVLLFNQKAWPRSETVYAKVWNKPLNESNVVVRDSEGNEFKGQVVNKGNYWGHSYQTVAFKADNVPATGYKVYAIDSVSDPTSGGSAGIVRELKDGTETMINEIGQAGVMENEFLRVEVDSKSGAIKHLIDKETGIDFVPEGKLMGVLEAYDEVPHGMTSWIIGQIKQVEQLTDGGQFTITQRGPVRTAVKCDRTFRDSTISVEIGLNSGSRTVDFLVNLHWVEIGTREKGVPMLRAAFPVNVTNGTPTYEIAFGSQTRAQSLQEIPALKWADLSTDTMGVTLTNDSKYGHSCVDDTLRLTLLRSSYDPDPLPEMGDHHIRFAVTPHVGKLDVVAATRLGEEINSPMSVTSASLQEGDMPSEKSFLESLSPNVFVSTIKKAEDSNAVVVRLWESQGIETTAKIKIDGLVDAKAKAVETDTLERPVAKSSAKFDGKILTVKVPAHGIATVKIG